MVHWPWARLCNKGIERGLPLHIISPSLPFFSRLCQSTPRKIIGNNLARFNASILTPPSPNDVPSDCRGGHCNNKLRLFYTIQDLVLHDAAHSLPFSLFRCGSIKIKAIFNHKWKNKLTKRERGGETSSNSAVLGSDPSMMIVGLQLQFFWSNFLSLFGTTENGRHELDGCSSYSPLFSQIGEYVLGQNGSKGWRFAVAMIRDLDLRLTLLSWTPI